MSLFQAEDPCEEELTLLYEDGFIKCAEDKTGEGKVVKKDIALYRMNLSHTYNSDSMEAIGDVVVKELGFSRAEDDNGYLHALHGHQESHIESVFSNEPFKLLDLVA